MILVVGVMDDLGLADWSVGETDGRGVGIPEAALSEAFVLGDEVIVRVSEVSRECEEVVEVWWSVTGSSEELIETLGGRVAVVPVVGLEIESFVGGLPFIVGLGSERVGNSGTGSSGGVCGGDIDVMAGFCSPFKYSGVGIRMGKRISVWTPSCLVMLRTASLVANSLSVPRKCFSFNFVSLAPIKLESICG
jgi:hypothetical protein